MTKQSLSIKEARKVILLSQKIPPTKMAGKAIDASYAAVKHLGYIQIDTISAIERAHHHTLWNRNPRYQNDHLSTLMDQKRIFEYWSHAAAYLPMDDFRFSLYRKKEIKEGIQSHWFTRNPEMEKLILKRIKEEGPLRAKDFEQVSHQQGAWQVKPTKQALETLFMQGDLMITRRENFHKVYDLTERVIPSSVDVTNPTKEEYARHLILSYLRANGLGQSKEMCYLLKNVKALIEKTLCELVEEQEIIELTVGEQKYYALACSLELLHTPLQRKKLKILSPFDNLVIQRDRVKRFFDFDYLIECYVPESKRQYGYFALPLLWDAQLVGRMDCKVNRKEQCLYIKQLHLEKGMERNTELFEALQKELIPFMKFNACREVKNNTKLCLKL